MYASVEAALERIGVDPPRVALLDIGSPGIDGIQSVRILRQRHPGIAPVTLSVYKGDDRIVQAMCAGARGSMLKQTPPARLVEAIRQIARGGAVVSPEVAIRVVELFLKVPPRESGSAGLSPQEMAEMMEATGSLPHPCGGLVAGSSADVFFLGRLVAAG